MARERRDHREDRLEGERILANRAKAPRAARIAELAGRVFEKLEGYKADQAARVRSFFQDLSDHGQEATDNEELKVLAYLNTLLEGHKNPEVLDR
jgi:hypothetical protein